MAQCTLLSASAIKKYFKIYLSMLNYKTRKEKRS